VKNGSRKKTDGASHSPQPADSRRQVEKRAYELWQGDGCRDGNDLNYWLQAERELGAARSGQSGNSTTGITL
jgi:hypothetical protein